MASSLPDRAVSSQHKPLAMKGEGLHKKFVNPETRALVGRLIDRAIFHSGLSKKETAYRLGYGEDQSPISRWTAGLEPPPLARLVSVPALCCGLSVALAEMSEGVEVRTVVSFRRLA